MRRIVAAFFGSVALAFAGLAPAQAEESKEGETSSSAEIQLAGPVECQDEETTEVRLTASNTGSSEVTFTVVSDTGVELDQLKLGGSESQELVVPYEPGAVYTAENGNAEFDTTTLPGPCPAQGQNDGANDGGAWKSQENAGDPNDCAAYVDSAGWCDEGVADYNCPEIDDSHKPIELVDPEVDPFGLDGNDNDGLGCESKSGNSGNDGGASNNDDENNDAGGDSASKKDAGSGDCDAYANSDAWCDDDFGDYDCADIDDGYKPITVTDPQDDPFRLDADNDGAGCEVPTQSDGGEGTGNDEEPDTDETDDMSGGDDSDDGATQDALPDTGANAAVLAASALVLFAGGAALVRRRAAAERSS